MSKIIRFIKIDMLSIKPYLTLKNALIFIGLGVFYSMVTSNLMIIFGVALLFVSLLSTYPFLVGDKTGIDSLYRVFGFKEKEIVIGRYVSNFVLAIIIQLATILLAFVLAQFIQTENIWSMVVVVIPIYLIISQLIVCIQYPFYFKYGYTKAKLMMSLTFVLFGVVGFLASYFKEQTFQLITWGMNHKMLMILLLIAMLLAIYLVSITTAIKWYKEKDLV